MTDSTTDPRYDWLRARVAALEADRTLDRQLGGFARCYPALATVLIAATFLPLYDRLVHEDSGISWRFGSIWQILGQDNSGASVLGLLLFFILATMLMVATFVPRVPAGMLVSCAVISVLLIVMILLKPAMPDPPPDIGNGGWMAIGVLSLIAAFTSAHVVTLRVGDASRR